MNTRIKLTDGLIRYALSGKKDNKEWQEFNGALVNNQKNRSRVIHDIEVKGFQVSRTGQDIISFQYYHRVKGKRKNITIGQFPAITTVQARLLAKEKALDVANGNNPVDDKKAIRIEKDNTLNAYLDREYTPYLRSRAIRADRYLAIIRNQFPAIINKPLVEINKDDLVKWVQFQKSQHDKNIHGYSSASIRQRFATLKTLFSHAIANEALDSNPFDKLPKLEFSKDEATGQQAKRTYLTLTQQQAFLKSVDAYDAKREAEQSDIAFHHKPMLLILYFMGMRLGDVIGLDWVHVIDTPFNCSITKVLEKTRRKVKTPYSFPMTKQVSTALRQWRKQQGNPTSGLVFPNPKTGKRLSPQPLDRCWNWIKQDADFHDDLQLYTLRHNFISWLIMDNIPLSVIAGMVGHSGTDMINRNYAHLIRGTDVEASQDFADLLEGKGAKHNG